MKQSIVTRLVRSVASLLVIAGALIGLSGASVAASPTLTVQTTPTALPRTEPPVGLVGSVVYRPRYQAMSLNPQPRLYLVVLDVTTSMSWNFAGQGTKAGQTVQCGATSDPNVQRRQCGANAPWREIGERRIYIAKQALMRFVDQLHTNDTMRLIAFSTRQVAANAAWVRGDSAGKLTLKHALLDAGKYQGGPYRTSGEAPTASALYLVGQLLAQAPQTAPNGTAYGAPLVILLTDSVANNFLLSDGSWRANDSSCVGVPFAEDIATCQVGYTNDNPPLARPITAMLLQADLLKQRGTTMYVIGLAGVDETGLRDVASAPQSPFFAAAQTGAELPAILDDIQAQTTANICIPGGGNTWMATLPQERAASIPPPVGPLLYPVVGRVYLSDKNIGQSPNGLYSAPIIVDAQTGRLVYHFEAVGLGTYQLRGFVVYKGDDDITRVYSAIFDPNTQTSSPTMMFMLGAPIVGQVVTLPPLYLDLDGSVCPAI